MTSIARTARIGALVLATAPLTWFASSAEARVAVRSGDASTAQAKAGWSAGRDHAAGASTARSDGPVRSLAGDFDTAATAWNVPLNTGWTIGNADATADGEPLSATDPLGCVDDNGAAQGIDKTRWWRFTGNGGQAIVTSFGTNIPAILAIYPASSPTTSSLIGCRVTGPSGPYGFRFQTTAGVDYVAQVGGLTGGAAGTLGFTVVGSDDVAFAAPVNLDTSADVTNIGATVAAGEPQVCGAATLTGTIWLRFHVPAQGKVSFSVNTNPIGTAPIAVALRRSDGGLVAACDTAVSGVGKTVAGVAAEVPAGDYYIQLGTPNGTGTFFHYSLGFARNLDVDGDGVQVAPYGKDCNDTNPAIRPGVADVVNGIDDDCDGVVDPDRDGDGYVGVNTPGRARDDCNDANKLIHPGVREIKGNRVDENCDGVKEPFPALSSTTLGYNASFTTFVVRHLPAGATVGLRCSGRGCPRSFHKLKKRYRRAKRSLNLGSRLSHRLFRAGAKIELTVTAPSYRGKRWRLTIRRSRGPALQIRNVGTGFQ